GAIAQEHIRSGHHAEAIWHREASTGQLAQVRRLAANQGEQCTVKRLQGYNKSGCTGRVLTALPVFSVMDTHRASSSGCSLSQSLIACHRLLLPVIAWTNTISPFVRNVFASCSTFTSEYSRGAAQQEVK